MFTKKKVGIISFSGILLIVIALVYLFNSNDSPYVVGKDRNGFTHEPLIFDDISFELVGSEYVGTLHTFHYNVKNVGNKPVRLSSIFAIVNGEKRFGTSEVAYSDSELNPNMDGTIEITFDMQLDDLINGEPKMEINRGFIFKNAIQIPLNKEKD